ncbi:MAG: NHL repeat-containing protein [Vicinamibacterales bacterium]|jgi:sugar lactone lactonase YvrE
MIGSALLLAALAAATFTFSTLAGTPGSVVNSQDGVGTSAQFDAPRGVAVDRAGNIYVADTRNNTVRKVSPSGEVTTLAGTPGLEGLVNGAGAAARFNEPFGLAVGDAGTVYVADASNNAIRKITADGVVSTVAGGGGAGSTDGTGTAARLDEPRGVALDVNGTLYVSDYDNHLIRKVSPAGVVTTLAGRADQPGNADGIGTAASFRGPMGIAVDATGIVYVADTGNRAVRRITTAGTVTTLALTGSSLSEPRGIAVDAAGVITIADYGSHTIRSIAANGAVTTLAGALSNPGTTDATGSAARFHFPSSIAATNAGVIYVADTENDAIRAIASGAVVATIAGQAGRTSSVDGQGAAARFEDPFSAAVDADGVVFIADSAAHVIRRITPDGTVTTYAGTPGSYGSADGTGAAARFYSPFGVAADRAGNLYVADSFNSTVRKIAPGGIVTTLAGAARSRGHTDGTGAAARFDQPFGIAADGNGTVYVSDATANTIRKITAAGVVSTLAGQGGSAGSADGTGTSARFTVPYGIAVDTAGTVFVVDHGNHTIRRVTAEGVVSTLAGTAGSAGSADGTGAASRFRYPSGVAVDREGNVFVADTDNHLIRQVTPSGEVTTVGGSGSPGSTDGVGTAARFFNPKGVAADAAGRIYVADRSNHTVRLGTR